MEMRDRIKAIRTHKNINMTQSEFSTALGLAPTSASNWEKKTNPQIPTESMRLLICEKFGINRHWLETGEGEMFAQQPNDAQAIAARVAREYGSNPLLQAFMTSYLQLDDAKRELVLEIVEGFTAALKDALAAGKPAPDISDHIQARVDALATARSRKIPLIQGTDESIIQMKYQSMQEQRELEQSKNLQSDPT